MWQAMIERIIATGVEHRRMQSDYFARREKVGEVVRPRVYQPKFESEAANLAVVFIEPGAAHLVFKDEFAPQKELDERYREARRKLFGRVHDVESVEFVNGTIKFVNNYAFVNIYESGLHWSSVEQNQGALFSDTWNHMLSAGGKWLNIIRGGYRLVEAPYIEGDRAAAENWSEGVQYGT